MGKELQIIEDTLKSDDTINQLIIAGSLPNDESGRTQANKYIMSIMGEIVRTEGTENAISQCSPGSIRQTLIDSFRFKVPIDGRKMAHIDVRWNKEKKTKEATLQIDTNGFVAKIAEHYPDFHIKATPVFQGDEFSIRDDGTVHHVQKNPFCSDVAKLEGMIVQASYTKGGRLINEAIPVTKHDLLAMKSASKVQGVWNNWTLERMKTAAIKRVSKWHFRMIQGLQEIIDYDNAQNYDLSRSPEIKTKTAIDSINEALSGTPKEEVRHEEPDYIDGESEVIEEPEYATQDEIDDITEMLVSALDSEDIKAAAERIKSANLSGEQKESMQALYKMHVARIRELAGSS